MVHTSEVGALSLLSNPLEEVEMVGGCVDAVEAAGPVDRSICVVRPGVGEKQARLRCSEQQVLVRAYISGSSVGKLADELGVHRSTVSACLKRHAVPPLDPMSASSPTHR